jgi:hypothetical protein
LKTAFRKISRVRSIIGGTRWYLTEDCLVAAKRTLYVVEYRRFYLRDLESILVWPNPRWLWRVLTPAAVFAILGACFYEWVDTTTGFIFFILAGAWVALELALGPTANSTVRTLGASVDLRLVKRARRASKVLAKIDKAVRAARGPIEQAATTTISPPEPALQTRSEAAAAASIAAATPTNAS